MYKGESSTSWILSLHVIQLDLFPLITGVQVELGMASVQSLESHTESVSSDSVSPSDSYIGT